MTYLSKFFATAAALATFGVSGPVVADGGVFHARNHMRVAPLNDVIVEVGGFTHRSGLFDYWCAVGEYMHRIRREPWQSKIYVVRGLGHGQVTNSRDAVWFTLDPVAAGVEPLGDGFRILSTLTVGRSESVTSAFYSCNLFNGTFSR